MRCSGIFSCKHHDVHVRPPGLAYNGTPIRKHVFAPADLPNAGPIEDWRDAYSLFLSFKEMVLLCRSPSRVCFPLFVLVA